MAFATGVPANDPAAEAKIAKAYATDPGASIDVSMRHSLERQLQ